MKSNKFMSAAAVMALTVVAFGVPAIAADAMKSSSSQSSSASMSPDQSFVQKAAVNGAFEVQASQIALSHSQNDNVRTFARQMIEDHGKANDKLYTAASDAKLEWPVASAGGTPDATGSISGSAMPGATMGTDTGTSSALEDSPVGGSRDPGQIGEGSTGGTGSVGDSKSLSADTTMRSGANATMHTVELDAKHQAMLDELNKLNGPAFDRVYLKQQTQAHADAVKLLKAYSADGTNADLKSFASETLPVVQKHDKMLRKIKVQS